MFYMNNISNDTNLLHYYITILNFLENKNTSQVQQAITNCKEFFSKNNRAFVFFLGQREQFSKTQGPGILPNQKVCGNDIAVLKYILKCNDVDKLNRFKITESGKMIHKDFYLSIFENKPNCFEILSDLKKKLENLKQKNFIFKFKNVYEYNDFIYIIFKYQDKDTTNLILYMHFFLKEQIKNKLLGLNRNVILKKEMYKTIKKNLEKNNRNHLSQVKDWEFATYETFFENILNDIFKKNTSEIETQEHHQHEQEQHHVETTSQHTSTEQQETPKLNINTIDSFEINWKKLQNDSYFNEIVFKVKNLLENENYINMLQTIAKATN